MDGIRGKVALVTGASRGIGRRIAVALAQEGMNLVLSARSLGALEETAGIARAAGVRVTLVAADLEDRDAVISLAQRAEAAFPDGVAVLVNNAAIEQAQRFEEVDPAAIEATDDDTYAATKHGLVGFSRSLRLTLQSEGHAVGVSVICPAFVEEEGMYETASKASGGTAPFVIGTVPMHKVERAVVRAIRRNDAEVVLTGKPMLPFLITQTVSPRLAGRMSALVGVPAMFKKWAGGNVWR